MSWLFYFGLGILVWWIISSLLTSWRSVTDSGMVDEILEYVICLPIVLVSWVCIAIAIPFICIWKFFRNAFKGVSVNAWETYHPDDYWKIGNVYFCYDRRARAISNKLFLVRVVKPRDYIAHCPMVERDNSPSVPSGEFR